MSKYDPDEEVFAEEVANDVAKGINTPYKYEPAGLPALVAPVAPVAPVAQSVGIPAALPVAKPATMYYQGVKAEQLPGSDKYYLPTYETNSETNQQYISGYNEIPTDQLNTTQYGHLVTPTKTPETTLAVSQVPASVWARYGVTDPSKLNFQPVIRTEYNGETGQSYDTFDLVDKTTGITLNEGMLGQTTGNKTGQLVRDDQGNLTYQEYEGGGGGWNLGNILSGAFKGLSNIASSDAVKYLAPFVLQGVMPGLNLTPASVGSNLYGLTGTAGQIAGGATLGAGTAALTGGDATKGALMGGFGAAGNVSIGDTGFNVGDLTKATNVIKSVENGDFLGAIVNGANIAGAGNTAIGDTGFTLNELAKDVNLAKAVISGYPQALVGALTSVAKEQAALDTKDANKIMGDYRTAGTDTGTTNVADQTPADSGTALASTDVAQDPNLEALLAEFSNPQDLSDNPSVQVAGTDNAGALEALRDATEAGRAGGAGSGTFFDSLGRLRIADEGESEEDARAAAEAAIEAEAAESIANAVNSQTPTDDGTTAGIDDQIAEQPVTIEDIQEIVSPTRSIAQPVTVPTEAEQQPSIEEFIKQIESTQPTPQTVEQITASETSPVVNQVAPQLAETPTSEVTPEVQALIDQAVTGQQESAQAEQPAIGQQTQDLLNELSGGTDTGVTPEEITPKAVEPAAAAETAEQTLTPDIIAELQDAGLTNEKIGIPTPESAPEELQTNVPAELPVPETVDEQAEWDMPVAPTELQDFINNLPQEQAEWDTPVEPSIVQNFIDSLPQEQAEWDTPVAPKELNTALTEIASPDQTDTTSLDEQDVLDFIKEHPDYENFDEDMLKQIEDPIPYEDEEDKQSVTPKLPVTPKTPVTPKPPVTPKTPAPKTPAVNTDALKTLLTALLANQQQQYLPGIGDVARIKSDESLFGAILGTSPERETETQYDPVVELLAQGDEEYARGGHVDEFSVEALLQILRS